MEYIKCFWNYIDNETPIICFYEVDNNNERYITRVIDIFYDGSIKTTVDYVNFVSEAPCPTIDEINEMDEFYSYNIDKEEFEYVWENSHKNYKFDL